MNSKTKEALLSLYKALCKQEEPITNHNTNTAFQNCVELIGKKEVPKMVEPVRIHVNHAELRKMLVEFMKGEPVEVYNEAVNRIFNSDKLEMYRSDDTGENLWVVDDGNGYWAFSSKKKMRTSIFFHYAKQWKKQIGKEGQK